MDTLGDIVAKKAIETLCDFWASQINGRYLYYLAERKV